MNTETPVINTDMTNEQLFAELERRTKADPDFARQGRKAISFGDEHRAAQRKKLKDLKNLLKSKIAIVAVAYVSRMLEVFARATKSRYVGRIRVDINATQTGKVSAIVTYMKPYTSRRKRPSEDRKQVHTVDKSAGMTEKKKLVTIDG